MREREVALRLVEPLVQPLQLAACDGDELWPQAAPGKAAATSASVTPRTLIEL